MKWLNSYQTTASRKSFDYGIVLGTSESWFVRLSSLFFLFFFLFICRREKFKQHIIPGTLQISLKTYTEGITSKLLYKNWTLCSQNYSRKKKNITYCLRAATSFGFIHTSSAIVYSFGGEWAKGGERKRKTLDFRSWRVARNQGSGT